MALINECHAALAFLYVILAVYKCADLLYVASMKLFRLPMVQAVLVGWQSGAIQEVMSLECWHVQKKLQECVKRFLHSLLVLHSWI